ncbi:MAG: hypothetical protein KH208_13980 [Desulfovibrio sp.]|uniref:hypothetical protein n=1 Tax=Desulfovibrio sp. TaxID=885 RepID=UPI0025BBB941|nr:hypothetical protein [Desulfovibrio sp.]MBS6830942.1 hypothetical protein [Desulfovibrio sp.]
MDTALFASVAAMLSGIGACASAVATWRTVRKMQKQREASYLPDIACSIPVFTQSEQVPKIKICNVGLGVAKDVLVSISVPLEEILPALNKDLQPENIRIEQEGDCLKIESILDDGAITSHTLSLPCAVHIKYLFPGLDNAMEARLPDYLHEIVHMVTERAFERSEKELMDILKGIRFKICVNFFDIGGQRHTAEYIYAMFDAMYDFRECTYKIRFK